MKKIIIVLICLLLVACHHTKRVRKPANLLSQTQVESILHDIYLADGSLRVRLNSQMQLDAQTWFSKEINAIMAKHNVTYAIFEESMNYYFMDSEKAKEIQSNVTNQLIQEQAKIELPTIETDTSKHIAHQLSNTKEVRQQIEVKQ
ncbi:MAG: DUF4296 domain-containing protein [Bacteroidales bacterium]|nr:DUF4296 domain-containing protein [Bacteroidales bacterium]